MSLIVSRHSVEGPTSLEVATRRLPNVDSLTIISEVIGMQLTCIIGPPLHLFAPDPLPKAL